MKTILEFSAEEQDEANIAINGWRYHATIWEFQQWLRGEMKHGDLTEEQYDSYDKIREKLFEIIEENKAHLE